MISARRLGLCTTVWLICPFTYGVLQCPTSEDSPAQSADEDLGTGGRRWNYGFSGRLSALIVALCTTVWPIILPRRAVLDDP